MSTASHLGLRLVGPTAPLASPALDAVEQARGWRLPRSYRATLEAWGTGQLCGFAGLFDPTDASPAAGWNFYRRFMATDGMTFRREYQHWRDVDDATWERLAVFADRDGRTFAWDTGKPDARGEYPIWFLDREGACAVLAARSLDELVERFLLGGAIDRVAPPAQGGHWELPATYVTRPQADLEARLLDALRAGDEERAVQVLALFRASTSGYDASTQLLEMLMRPTLDASPELRCTWLERAIEDVARCSPGQPDEQAARARVASLRDGRSLDDAARVDATVESECEPLTLSCAVAAWDAATIECTVRNPGTARSRACEIEAWIDDTDGSPPEMWCQRDVEALEPGGECRVSVPAGWSERASARLRVGLRSA